VRISDPRLQDDLHKAIAKVLDRHGFGHVRVEDFDGLTMRMLRRPPGGEVDFFEIRLYDIDAARQARDKLRSLGKP
jgi:hypothetical protein